MVYVYAIVSLTNGFIYVGISQDIDRRLAEHNARKSKFTKSYVPWKLFYFEACKDYTEARAREKALKTHTGKEFLKAKLAGA